MFKVEGVAYFETMVEYFDVTYADTVISLLLDLTISLVGIGFIIVLILQMIHGLLICYSHFKNIRLKIQIDKEY